MAYKIIVLDLDGTLTNEKKEITPKTYDALMKAQDLGVRVVLASGRPTFGIMPIAKQLNLADHDGFILAYNGGKIISCRTGETIYNKVLFANDKVSYIQYGVQITSPYRDCRNVMIIRLAYGLLFSPIFHSLIRQDLALDLFVNVMK